MCLVSGLHACSMMLGWSSAATLRASGTDSTVQHHRQDTPRLGCFLWVLHRLGRTRGGAVWGCSRSRSWTHRLPRAACKNKARSRFRCVFSCTSPARFPRSSLGRTMSARNGVGGHSTWQIAFEGVEKMWLGLLSCALCLPCFFLKKIFLHDGINVCQSVAVVMFLVLAHFRTSDISWSC